MYRWRGVFRLLAFAWITSLRLAHILLLSFFFGKDERVAIRLRRKLANRLVRLLGIDCEFQGEIPTVAFVGVTNHRSYIDSVCIFKWVDACPVVKAEVSRWPLIGWGLKHTATVFVERERKASRQATRSQIAQFVLRGISTIVFVEGTTYRGPEIGAFRPGTFITAAMHNLPVLPIAIEFSNPDAAWVGNDTFVPHFINYFGKNRRSRVKVSFGPLRYHEDGERLQEECHKWVAQSVKSMQAAFLAES